MPPLTPQNLILSLLLIAPGFIAFFVAVTIGAVESEVSNGRVLIVSLVSSILVDTLFLTIADFAGESVNDPYAFQEIIFGSNFSPKYVALLIGLSLLLGLFYSISIILDLQGKARTLMWSLSDKNRFPWQPWEGMMQDSAVVQVQTSDEELVKGFLHEYSRAERPRQLRLKTPQWFGEQEWNPPEETDVLLLEDDISRISVLMTVDRYEEIAQEMEEGE
ncbi:DUF6338 family protein [Halococcus sp. IIIV-5B]|uniref:DUF6338 family protein n=1 Tax=Halococcus sp. IIIV-5B TaxID=2321230 RepID=UPI000E7331C4|nr:DUF6338 family protein [Halococcus sp. IIIV-5B]RJS96280.1 hypothetical protein D3261_19270 [Halococcus sp. IIIV-5B]